MADILADSALVCRWKIYHCGVSSGRCGRAIEENLRRKELGSRAIQW